MKIGVMTLNGYHNYGNRLQNYALHNFIEGLSDGIKVDTIWVEEKSEKMISNAEIIKAFRRYIFNRHGFRDYVKSKKYTHDYIREYNIRKFSKKYTNENKVNNIEEISNEYDYFIAGSDQIWNPNWINGYVEFLQFADKKKRISYSASFGVRDIPQEKIKDFSRYINGMEHISVREQAGAEIVQDLCGFDVPVLVDPTLLITKDEWSSIAEKPWWLEKDKYMMVFFLGGMSEQESMECNKIAESYDLKIVNILDKDNLDYYTSSPEEFMYLIKNASIVLTDSFHATVFSIIMNTPFLNFSRKGMEMNSRIDTLLNLFGMNERRVIDGEPIRLELFNVDFSNVEECLKIEREKSRKFLLKALHIKG